MNTTTTTRKRFPRKNTCRLYRDKDGSYLIVIDENGRNGSGMLECIANVMEGSNPSICSTSCSDGFLRRCKRVEWSDLPKEWQNAFRHIMREWDTPDPKDVRGFWAL